MTTQSKFFNQFEKAINEKVSEIKALETKLEMLQNELNEAQKVKQQYKSIDAIANTALEQLDNAIESINFAYHNIGSTSMGESYIAEFKENVDASMSKLRNQPTTTEMLEEVEVDNSEEANPTPTNLAISSDPTLDKLISLASEIGCETMDEINATMKSFLGSSSYPTKKAIVNFHEKFNYNVFLSTKYDEMKLSDLKTLAQDVTGFEIYEDMKQYLKENYGINNRASIILLLIEEDLVTSKK